MLTPLPEEGGAAFFSKCDSVRHCGRLRKTQAFFLSARRKFRLDS
jgi:hypothetical protein